MTKRGRDKSCYDFKNTPMWLKLVPQRKRSKREIYESKIIQDLDYIIGQQG